MEINAGISIEELETRQELSVIGATEFLEADGKKKDDDNSDDCQGPKCC